MRSAWPPSRRPATSAIRGPGSPWQPAKLYYTVFSVARFREIHQKFEELGLESPFDEQWRKRWEDIPAEIATTSVDISDFADIRRQALLAHATQVDPKSPFWFGLPPEVMRSIHPFDDYRLARTASPAGGSGGTQTIDPSPALDGESDGDLFVGVRAAPRVSG